MFTRRSILARTASQIAHVAAANGHDPLELAAKVGMANASRSEAGTVNVIDFGADPKGLVDSSDAILRAIERCLAGPDSTLPQALYFPPGRFLITRNNLFRSTPRRHPIYSWDIFGAGSRTTVLVFRPRASANSAETYYLYDGYFDEKKDDPNATLLGLRLANLSIQLDAVELSIPAKVSCFRQFGSGRSGDPEQNWTFINCSFRGDEKRADMNGAILEIVGDANGSENAFINCRAIIFGHVIDCLNPQAVNHLSLFCHWEVILGDMFRFIRGGNLTLLGGSIILSNFGHAPEWKPQTAYLPNAIFYFDGRRFRTSKGGISGNRKIEGIVPVHFDGAIEWDLEGDDSAYVLRVGGDLTGQINSYLISGARIELRSNKAKLLGGGDLNTRALVTFDGVAVQPVVGGARHTIELAESSTSIHFSNCKLARASSIWEEPFSVLFGRGPSALNRRDGARILLDGCVVSEHIHDLSVWGENSMAAITLQNCVVGYQEARTLPGQSYTRIVDGTVMGVSRAKSSNTSRSGKHLQVFFQYWPGSLPEDSIHICLPPQAMLLRVHFVKLGTSTSTSKYELFLRDGEGNELFRSDLVNLAGPFEIETPRLFVRSPSGGLLLSIQGSDYKRPATKAGPSDCIILDWMA